MSKNEAFRFLTYSGCKDLAFVANVFLTCGGANGAKNLKAAAKLVKAGHEVRTMSFSMPNERLVVNGKVITPGEMRDMAATL